MISVLEELRRPDSSIFDRLADDELWPDDRRALLVALDDEPGGWRRCALAFVEVQALGRELAAWRDEETAGQNGAAESRPAADVQVSSKDDERQMCLVSVPPGRRRDKLRILAVAAVLSLTFGLGLLCGMSRLPGGTSAVRPTVVADRPTTERPRTAARGQEFTDHAASNDDGALDEPASNEAYSDETARRGIVRLKFADAESDADKLIDLPVVDATEFDPNWFSSQTSAVPEALLEDCRRAGHHVVQRQEVWPIDLADGRRLLVPVEQVDVDYSTSSGVY